RSRRCRSTLRCWPRSSWPRSARSTCTRSASRPNGCTPRNAACAASWRPDRMDAEKFRDDVLGEPDALAAMLDAYDGPDSPLRALGPLRPLQDRRVVLIGMGSSGFAALPAAARLRARGVHAVAELASAGVPAP